MSDRGINRSGSVLEAKLDSYSELQLRFSTAFSIDYYAYIRLGEMGKMTGIKMEVKDIYLLVLLELEEFKNCVLLVVGCHIHSESPRETKNGNKAIKGSSQLNADILLGGIKKL